MTEITRKIKIFNMATSATKKSLFLEYILYDDTRGRQQQREEVGRKQRRRRGEELAVPEDDEDTRGNGGGNNSGDKEVKLMAAHLSIKDPSTSR